MNKDQYHERNDGKHQIDVAPACNISKKFKNDAGHAPPASSSSLLEDFLQNENVWSNTLRPLLDPIDLIRLMHTSKASRLVAAPILNKLETDANQTVCHTEMFRKFLRRPRITERNHVWKELKNPSGEVTATNNNSADGVGNDVIPGPLRLSVIAARASEIEQRFAILQYEKSYDEEKSLVVVFDEKGAFICHYVFSSDKFYEDYVTRDIVSAGEHSSRSRVFDSDGGINTSMPNIRLASSGYGWGDAANVEKWRGPERAQTEYMWNEGWHGCVLLPHIALIDSFAGTLSPTEAFFVLMHSLSSDTRIIYVMMISFFDRLAYSFDEFLELIYDQEIDMEEARQWLTEFRQKLSQFSYTTEN